MPSLICTRVCLSCVSTPSGCSTYTSSLTTSFKMSTDVSPISYLYVWIQWKCISSLVKMSLHSLYLLYVRSLVLWIFPYILRCFHLLHAGSCRSIWKILWTSLQVLMPHPRHHSSWTGTLLPFLLGYFFIDGRLYINDVVGQCHITALSLRPLSFFESIVVLFFILDSFLNCRHLFFGTSLILLWL